MKHYAFVDYATQCYAALVVVLIAFFHNGTVPRWGVLLAANAAVVVMVHGLILWHGRGKPNKVLDFLRHFYPVLLYTFFFCETGLLNRMFFTDYLDPVAIRWEQAVFRHQPSVLFMQNLPYLAVSELARRQFVAAENAGGQGERPRLTANAGGRTDDPGDGGDVRHGDLEGPLGGEVFAVGDDDRHRRPGRAGRRADRSDPPGGHGEQELVVLAPVEGEGEAVLPALLLELGRDRCGRPRQRRRR